MKRIAPIVIGLIAGAFMTYLGARELTNSVKLGKRGQPTTAEVVSARDRVSGRLRRHTYYLTIAFKDATGHAVQKEVKVTKDVSRAAQQTGSTKAFYLSEDPTICAAGEVVDLRYGNLLIGLLVLGGAGFLALTLNAPASLCELAERIEQKLEPLMASRHEYAPADLADFRHLDAAYYDEGQKFLEGRGYTFVADRENVTVRNSSGTRTVLRLLLGNDQATQAFLYHFKHISAASSKESKVLDLQTSFSNGCFVCTSNAHFAGKLEAPPSTSSLFIPGKDWTTVLETHEGRVADYLDQHPGVERVRINGVEEFHRVMDKLQGIKAAFRREQGISQSELERISGKSGPQIQELAEILKRRWEERTGARVSPAQPA